MSTLNVTRPVLDTWEYFNNHNSVDQLQPQWLTSCIKKYGGAPIINADRLAGPASTLSWPTSWMRSFRCGAAPPATASLVPTIDQKTGEPDWMRGAGVAKRHLYGKAPGVDTAAHAPQAEISAS